MPVGAYLCDPAGLITFFNQGAADLWGREPKLNDAADRYCGSLRLFWPDGAPMAHSVCWMARALKQDQEFNGQEVVIERPDGQRLPVLAYANPIRDEAKNMTGALNLLVPIDGEPAKPRGTSTLTGLRILMVRDQPEETAAFSNLMQALGHEVRLVLDGLTAVRAAGQFHPDVVLIDINLPKMDGYEVVRLMRKKPWGQQTHLVALRARDQPEDLQRARAAGFDEELEASLNLAEVLPILASITAGSEH